MVEEVQPQAHPERVDANKVQARAGVGVPAPPEPTGNADAQVGPAVVGVLCYVPQEGGIIYVLIGWIWII